MIDKIRNIFCAMPFFYSFFVFLAKKSDPKNIINNNQLSIKFGKFFALCLALKNLTYYLTLVIHVTHKHPAQKPTANRLFF